MLFLYTRLNIDGETIIGSECFRKDTDLWANRYNVKKQEAVGTIAKKELT